MKKISVVTLFVFLTGLAGCVPTITITSDAPADADLVFINADVYTVDAVRRWTDTVAIRGEHIIYTGTASGAEGFIGPNTNVVDLQGKMVLPGFQDSHIHPPAAGIAYQDCPLFEMDQVNDVLAKIRSCVEADPDASFIRGEGWSVALFENGIPHKRMLDEIDDSRPLYFLSADGHTLWVNSPALDVMGVTAETSDPHGGRIERDANTGDAIGVLQEDATIKMAWDNTPYADEDIEDGLRFAVGHLNSLGITSVQDALVKVDSNDPYDALEAYRKLDASGELTLRSTLALYWEIDKGAEQIADFVKAREAYTNGNVRATSIKFWLDGVMEPKTAALLEPYEDGSNTAPYVEQSKLNEHVAKLDELGFQVHIHGIGDAAIRSSLDAFEHTRNVNGVGDGRHHICHLQLIDPADIPRFKELDVVANFQPLWALMDDYVTELTFPIIGPERSRWLYPIGSVLKTGAVVAFGSDWYVSTADPLPQIETAVTREDAYGQFPGVLIPEERIDLADAIAAFTINAAFVNHQDDTTGSIEAGKLADLVVLDKNLFEIPPSEISDAKVLLTLLGGQVVFGELDEL